MFGLMYFQSTIYVYVIVFSINDIVLSQYKKLRYVVPSS